MAIDRNPEWVTRSLSAAELDLDPDSPEFIAACLAVINQSASSTSDSDDDRHEGVHGKADEAGSESSDAQSPGPRLEADHAGSAHGILNQLEMEIGRLSEELSKAHEGLSETTPILREHAEARQKLTQVLSIRASEANERGRKKSAGSTDPETLQQLVDAILVERDADKAALREARRREDQVRAELQALEAQLSEATTKHEEAEAARTSLQRDQEIAIEDLRQTVSERNQEIIKLQEQLLQSEQARAADAVAIIDSLDKYRA